CTSIETSTIGIVETWGKFDRLAHPGFLCLNCCSERLAGKLDMRVGQLAAQVETKTHDDVFVHVQVVVQYQALEDQAFNAWYKLRDPKQQITSYINNEVRAIIPSLKLNDAFLEKNKVYISEHS